MRKVKTTQKGGSNCLNVIPTPRCLHKKYNLNTSILPTNSEKLMNLLPLLGYSGFGHQNEYKENDWFLLRSQKPKQQGYLSIKVSYWGKRLVVLDWQKNELTVFILAGKKVCPRFTATLKDFTNSLSKGALL
jgi:hypothetical protein